jgi:nitrogen fixation protein NifB
MRHVETVEPKPAHPCFCEGRESRRRQVVHVPLANRCDAGCIYCGFEVHKNLSSEAMPGFSDKCLKNVDEIEAYLSEKIPAGGEDVVVGVSGPGDPLSSLENLSALFQICRRKLPSSEICLCTNGFGYARARELLFAEPRVRYMSFTVNALSAEVASRIYLGGRADEDRCRELLRCQWGAVRESCERGLFVKINCVYLPGINADEVLEVADLAQSLGVTIFNLVTYRRPLSAKGWCNQPYPRLPPVSRAEREGVLESIRLARLKVKDDCRQCRSDFCGRL